MATVDLRKPVDIKDGLIDFIVSDDVTVTVDTSLLRTVWQEKYSLIDVVRTLRVVRFGDTYLGLAESKRIADYCKLNLW